MPQETSQKKPRAIPLLVLAALLLVLTFGIVFTAMMTHALLARHQSFTQAHQSQQMRLRSPHEEKCPGLSGRAPSYHHAHRDRLTVGNAAAPGCLPASSRWV